MHSYHDFIKSNKELNELPFMVVLRTLQILDGLNLLHISEEEKHVD